MQKKFISCIVGAAAFAAFAAFAADFNTVKYGDLADNSIYTGGQSPADKEINFVGTTASGTYTASKDVTLGAVIIRYPQMVFDLGDKKVDVVNRLTANGYAIGAYAQTPNCTFKGGIWDLHDGTFSVSWAGAYNYSTFTFDGTTFNNVGSFYFGDRNNFGTQADPTKRSVTTIKNGSVVNIKGDLVNFATGRNADLVVTGGSKVTVNGTLMTDRAGNPNDKAGNNSVTISGAGTKVTVDYKATMGDKKGTSYIGRSYATNVLTVCDGAEFENSTPIHIGVGDTGSAYARGNKVIVDNATLRSGTIYVGQNKAAYDNELIVKNGAKAYLNYLGIGGNNDDNEATAHDNVFKMNDSELEVSNGINVGWPGHNNLFSASNSTVKAKSISLGCYTACASNNTFTAIDSSIIVDSQSGIVLGNKVGANGQTVALTNCTIDTALIGVGGYDDKHFYSDNNCLILKDCTLVNKFYHLIEDGRNLAMGWTSGNYIELDNTDLNMDGRSLRFGYIGANNTFVIKNGSTFTESQKTSAIGLGNANRTNNTIKVLNGAYMDICRFRLMNSYCTMVISNATVTCTDQGNGFCVGYREGEGYCPTNATLVLQGDTPKIKGKGTTINVWFVNQAIMNVQLPAQGYAKGYVPIEANIFTLSGNSRITFGTAQEPFEQSDFYKKVGGRVKLVMANSMSYNKDAITASNALLPSDCRLEVANNALYLVTPSRQATTVQIR